MRRLLVLLALAVSIGVHAQDPNLQRGFAPGKVYDFLGLDSVSLMNGNLNVRIPLGQKYSLGPALEYQFMLAYNSKVWEIEYAGVGASPQLPQSWAVTETRSNAGFGWNLTLGMLLPPKIHGVQGPQQGWTYLAPDGSEHEFPTVASDPTLAFTEDGSYLRLRRIPADPNAAVTHREIDLPDGSIRQFDTSGNLTEVRDRYGYKVKVERTATVWTVTEEAPGGGTGRTHTIELASALNFDGQPYVQQNFQTRPVEVNLAAFGAGSNVATYQLAYTDAKITVGPCADALHDSQHYVPRLNSITFPDQSAFVMTYLPSAVDRCTSGTLNVLTLPTGGKISWTLGQYELTNQACIEPRPGIDEEGWRKAHAGVRTRTLEKFNGDFVEKRTYTPELPVRPGGLVSQRCGDLDLDQLEKPPDVFKNTVTVSAPTSQSSERVVEKTTNYFSAYPAVVDGTMASADLTSPAQGIEYGLPIARGTYVGDSNKPETLRFLSSQTYACDGTTCSNTVVRTTYLKYAHEQSFTVSGSTKAKNPRVDAQRTVFEDDSCGGSCRYYRDSASSDWDDFGHYRQSVFTSNIPGTREKTTFTNFMPDSTNWLLNKYDDAWVREGTGTAATGTRSQATFDPASGMMTSLRTYKAIGSDPASFAQSGNDLLTAWCRDAVHGFVTSERYFGGDGGAVPSTPCTASRGTNDYFINHTYTFDGAIVATHKAQYAGTAHFIADEEYDRNTGWPKLVRDSAGVPAKYTFDSHARILSIRPYDSVETHYDYREATGDPHKIAVRQVCPTYEGGVPTNPAQCTAGSLTRTVYYYDDLGRLIQERRQYPSLVSGAVLSRWAVTSTHYGPLGRKEWVSVPFEESSEAYSAPGAGVTGTSWSYDHLGRVTLETRPDGTTSSFVYRGNRETERWVGGQKRSTETFNGLGQLVKVTQSPDSSGKVVTSYGYDAGGRLTSVRMTTEPSGPLQERMFDYDGRGFLRWESQPESGMASYTYDARGHVTAKDQSAARTQFDLRYAYDDAERLITLSARDPHDLDEFRPLKEFTFGEDNGTSGSAVDLRKGKLVTASRYNYGAYANDDIYKITDTYRYLDAAGRRTHRTTSIIEFEPGYGDMVLKNVDMSVSYNALGLPRNVQYPTCTNCGLPSVDPIRDAMDYTYRHGRLGSITGLVNDMSYWPSGLRNTLAHSNGRTDKQTVTGVPRPSRIEFMPTPASRCLQPTFVSPPANTHVAVGGGSATLSVVAGGTAPFEYEWVRVSDGVTVGETASITVNVTADESFYVVVKNACGYEQSATVKVTVGGCVAPTIGGIAKIRQPDGKWLLKPQLAARQNPTFSWLRLSDSQEIAQTETAIVPAPGAQVTYRLTVTDSCGSVQSETTLTPAPTITATALVATATEPLQVTVSWPESFNVSHYVVERRSGMSWEYLGDASTNTYVDSTVQSGRSYAYRVYAVRFSEKSDYSNSDIATTRSFTPATVGGSFSVVPVNEMLAAVNSVRGAVGWPAVTWDNILVATDSIPASSGPVTATHITSARTRMNEALSALGVPLSAYTDPVLSGAPIRAVHINEVQQRAQ